MLTNNAHKEPSVQPSVQFSGKTFVENWHWYVMAAIVIVWSCLMFYSDAAGREGLLWDDVNLIKGIRAHLAAGSSWNSLYPLGGGKFFRPLSSLALGWEVSFLSSYAAMRFVGIAVVAATAILIIVALSFAASGNAQTTFGKLVSVIGFAWGMFHPASVMESVWLAAQPDALSWLCSFVALTLFSKGARGNSKKQTGWAPLASEALGFILATAILCCSSLFKEYGAISGIFLALILEHQKPSRSLAWVGACVGGQAAATGLRIWLLKGQDGGAFAEILENISRLGFINLWELAANHAWTHLLAIVAPYGNAAAYHTNLITVTGTVTGSLIIVLAVVCAVVRGARKKCAAMLWGAGFLMWISMAESVAILFDSGAVERYAYFYCILFLPLILSKQDWNMGRIARNGAGLLIVCLSIMCFAAYLAERSMWGQNEWKFWDQLGFVAKESPYVASNRLNVMFNAHIREPGDQALKAKLSEAAMEILKREYFCADSAACPVISKNDEKILQTMLPYNIVFALLSVGKTKEAVTFSLSSKKSVVRIPGAWVLAKTGGCGESRAALGGNFEAGGEIVESAKLGDAGSLKALDLLKETVDVCGN